MKSFQTRLGITVAGLALLAAPAFAGQRPSQDNGSPAADRAVERGSGTGGSTAARGGDGASATTAGSSVASSSVTGGARNAPPAPALVSSFFGSGPQRARHPPTPT